MLHEFAHHFPSYSKLMRTRKMIFSELKRQVLLNASNDLVRSFHRPR